MQETLFECSSHRDLLEHTQYYLVGLKSDMEMKRAVSKDEAQVWSFYQF